MHHHHESRPGEIDGVEYPMIAGGNSGKFCMVWDFNKDEFWSGCLIKGGLQGRDDLINNVKAKSFQTYQQLVLLLLENQGAAA